HTVSYPGGADTRGEIDRLAGDVTGGVAVDEVDPVDNPQFGGAGTGPLGEHRADVHSGPGDAVVTRPGAQQLTRTAREVEHARPGPQVQRPAQGGDLVTGER